MSASIVANVSAMGRGHLLWAFLVPAALCAAWTIYAGKDVNWDLLNYHYYAPFQLLEGRLQQDFFAASAQSYLNPIGYLPFYVMVSSGWHSVAVSLALALAHSVNLGLLYLIALRLFAHLPLRERVVLAALGAALGAATGVYWATVGSSFLDPLLAAAMLAGLLLLLDEHRRALRRATLAGALFGAVAALKYSHVIFALAALPLALSMPGLAGAARLRAGAAFAAGAAAALAVLAGPWLVLLAREFGNPVYPMLNAWFPSPDAPSIALASVRFSVDSLTDALAFVFQLSGFERRYSEILAPDVRFAALAIAVAALPAARMLGARGAALGPADARVLGFFAPAMALWLATSANGRYGMIVLLLAGVCLARIVERLLAARAGRISVAVLLAVQVVTTAIASPPRWFIAEAWSGSWLPYAVPARALREPFLYLTLEALPMAAVAPLVHPDSAFVNLRGLHSLPPDSPRLTALLERHRGRVRALGRALALKDGRPSADQLQAYDATLARIGYRVAADDCFVIAWQPDGDDALSRAANRLTGRLPAHEPLSAVACALSPASPDPARIALERRMSLVFDRIERSCAGLFRGLTSVTEPLGPGWSRFYSGLDARIETRGDMVVLNRFRTLTEVRLGRLADWEAGRLPAGACAP